MRVKTKNALFTRFNLNSCFIPECVDSSEFADFTTENVHVDSSYNVEKHTVNGKRIV